jgi:hypothetical protein
MSSTGASWPTNAAINQPPLDMHSNPSEEVSALSAFASSEGAGWGAHEESAKVAGSSSSDQSATQIHWNVPRGLGV